MTCGCNAHNGLLTAKGRTAAEQREFELDDHPGIAMMPASMYIDSMLSVSGSRRDETVMIFDEGVIDEQYRRFLEPLQVT